MGLYWAVLYCPGGPGGQGCPCGPGGPCDLGAPGDSGVLGGSGCPCDLGGPCGPGGTGDHPGGQYDLGGQICQGEQGARVVRVVWVIQAVQAAKMVQMVMIISPDDIWFCGLYYQEKLRCHARDERRTDGRKVENRAVF